MKYFNVTIKRLKDGTYAPALWQRESLNEAESAFHSELASALISDNLAGDTEIVMDEKGGIYFTRNWEAPISAEVTSGALSE